MCVSGEPGVGKTRLVLEATSTDDLSPLVMYYRSSSHRFLDDRLLNELRREDRGLLTLLVIDDCDDSDRATIWNSLRHLGPRVKFVSIQHEYKSTTGAVAHKMTPALDEETVAEIIQSYAISEPQAKRFAHYCDGSPRAAHVFGLNLKNDPQDLFRSPDTVDVWGRWVAGSDHRDSDEVKQRRIVLRHIALFKRFGYGRPAIDEAKAIARMVEEVDPTLTWARFQEIVRSLQIRKILQGIDTLYITPKLLHIKLWAEWWEVYGDFFLLGEFLAKLTGSLPRWFLEMFEYARHSTVAANVVQDLLASGGPFADHSALRSRLAADFFFTLARSHPAAALRCLKRLLGPLDREQLLEFTDGRREVVWSLEYIAAWRDQFYDAAQLLLALAEAENEPGIGNNASGVFAELFSPALGEVAPTEAPPDERFPILAEALKSDSPLRRKLALRACGKALQSDSFVRTVGVGERGLGPQPERWRPKTYGELFDAYRRVWNLLREQLTEAPADERDEIVDILLSASWGIGRWESLAEMVAETMRELASQAGVDRKKLLEHVIDVADHEENLPESVREIWKELEQQLTGQDYTSHLRRYVALSPWRDFDKERKDPNFRVMDIIAGLADEAMTEPGKLERELPWLVTKEAERAYMLGLQLGARDRANTFLPKILEQLKAADDEASPSLLGSYLRAVFDRDRAEWLAHMRDFAADPSLRHWVPDLIRFAELTDDVAGLVLDLVKGGHIPLATLRIFSGMQSLPGLSEEVLREWTEYVVSDPSGEAGPIGLELCERYYVQHAPVPPESLTERLLFHDSLFSDVKRLDPHGMAHYHWAQVARTFIEAYPDKRTQIAGKVLERFGRSRTILDGPRSRVKEVLNEIAQAVPNEIWKLCAPYLGPPSDERALEIRYWLQGERLFTEGDSEDFLAERDKNSVLNRVPLELLWGWVDEKIEKRAWCLASFVPRGLFIDSNGKPCLARQLLIRYGDREDVRRNLIANFSSEGWMGPESSHLEGKRAALLDYRDQETHPRVRSWVDEYVSGIDQSIRSAKFREERED